MTRFMKMLSRVQSLDISYPLGVLASRGFYFVPIVYQSPLQYQLTVATIANANGSVAKPKRFPKPCQHFDSLASNLTYKPFSPFK